MAELRTFSVGRRLWNEGEKLSSNDMNMAEWGSNRLALHLFAELFRDALNGEAAAGVFGEDSFAVSIDSGLTLAVAPGFAMVLDSTMSEGDDPFEPAYEPVWLGAEDTVTLSAHHATLPRIDVISVAVDTTDDQDESDQIKDPGDGTISTSTISTRRVYGALLTVTAGTPGATPTAPATPTNHLKLAEVNVPATSGAVVVHDYRRRLLIGEHVGGGATRSLPVDWVPGSSTECLAASAGTSMVVTIAAGLIVCAGQVYWAPRGQVTISAAHATLYRRDIIVYQPDTGWAIVTGTPALVGSVADPAVTAGDTPVARVRVDPAVVVIAADHVDDYRVRQPIQTQYIEDDAITAAKIADGAVQTAKLDDEAVTTAKIDDEAVTEAKLATGCVVESKLGDFGIGAAYDGSLLGASPITVSIQATYLSGNNRGFTHYLVKIVDRTTGDPDAALFEINSPTTGTAVTTAPGQSVEMLTNSSGVLEFTVEKLDAAVDAQLQIFPLFEVGIISTHAVDFT